MNFVTGSNYTDAQLGIGNDVLTLCDFDIRSAVFQSLQCARLDHINKHARSYVPCSFLVHTYGHLDATVDVQTRLLLQNLEPSS